jgi:hypothetical protein
MTFTFGFNGGIFCSLLGDTVGSNGAGFPAADTGGTLMVGSTDTAGGGLGLLLAGCNLTCLGCVGSIL